MTDERGIRVPLTNEFITYARKRAKSEEALTQELASLAGSLYLMGGRATYMLSRDWMAEAGDVPGANVTFFGALATTKDEVYSRTMKVSGPSRRRGWVWYAVSVSPVVKKDGGEMATAMIVGYFLDAEGGENDLELPYLQTTPPVPMRWFKVTDPDKGKVDWPESVRRSYIRHREAEAQYQELATAKP